MDKKLSSQLESWIETRLMNIKMKRKKIIIKEIIAEVSSLFKIPLTKSNEKFLKETIHKIKKRVEKRYLKNIEFIEQMSEELIVPVNLIKRWFDAGWLDPLDKQKNKNWLTIIRERDYFHQVKPQIPSDPTKPIWYDEN